MKILEFKLPQGRSGRLASQTYHHIRKELERLRQIYGIRLSVLMPQHYAFLVTVQDRDYVILCLMWRLEERWQLIGDCEQKSILPPEL